VTAQTGLVIAGGGAVMAIPDNNIPLLAVGTVLGGVLMVVGGVRAARGRSTQQSDRTILEQWHTRHVRQQLDRHDRNRPRTVHQNPRQEATAGLVARILGLDVTSQQHRTMVDLLQARVAQLVQEEDAARTALAQLQSAGAPAAATESLTQAAGTISEEIARILTGLSELYAALLTGGVSGDPLADLRETLSWLEAEAEVEQAARAEALRLARVAQSPERLCSLGPAELPPRGAD